MAGNIKAGNFPITIERTLVDKDGVAVDVSAYSTIHLDLIMPDKSVVTFEGEFSTNGHNGKVRYITASADDISQSGHYQGQFRLSSGSGLLHSDRFHFDVDAPIVQV